jgi:hypothetical protein
MAKPTPPRTTEETFMGIRTMRGRLLASFVVAAVAALSLPAASAPAAPGNNGVVKIDNMPFDSYPDNEPHVGCVFQVDFYNYEQGDFFASVKFFAQPPTGKDILLTSDSVFIGGDPAGGGTDLDGSGTYNLGPFLKSFMAHPNQGFHIKLKVHAPFSIGKDTKYKTFWVAECVYGG